MPANFFSGHGHGQQMQMAAIGDSDNGGGEMRVAVRRWWVSVMNGDGGG